MKEQVEFEMQTAKARQSVYNIKEHHNKTLAKQTH